MLEGRGPEVRAQVRRCFEHVCLERRDEVHASCAHSFCPAHHRLTRRGPPPTTPSSEPGAQQKERPYRQSLSLPQGTCGPSQEKASPLCTGHRSHMSSEKPILTPSDVLMNKWRLDVTQGSETRAGRQTLPNTSFHLPSLEILDSTGDAPFAKPPLVGFGEASKIFRNDAKKAMKIPLPFSS